MTSAARPLPDVHTITGLPQALKMLGYRIAVDGDHGAETRQVVNGAETRQVVMSFQMRAGIVAEWSCRRTDGSETTQRAEPYARDGRTQTRAPCAAPLIVRADVGSRLSVAGTWSLRKTRRSTGAAVVGGTAATARD